MSEDTNDKRIYEGWPESPDAGDEQAAEDENDALDEISVGEPSVEEEVDEMAALTAERDDYLDQLLRSRAEFANYRRRIEQERQVLRDVVQRDVLAQFLPVIDDFNRGLAAIPESERADSWVQGITMIQSKLNGILERAGIKEVDALHQPFDPALHEAVATDPGSKGDTVVEVYQKGYRLGDLLVRPAMVKTGDAPADAFDA